MVGKWLKKAREEAGLSQVVVARRAGIDRSYLSDLERDKQSPTLNVFVRICRAMKIPAAEVLANAEKSAARKR